MIQDMRFFHLVRDVDETGISGTGIVAEVAKFSDGTSIVRWLPSNLSGIASTVIYPSLEALERIHGHGGKTRLVDLGL